MMTIFLEHKGTSDMPGESQEGFFDFSIKRENLYAFGFGGWPQFIQREVPSDYYPVVLKIQASQYRPLVSEGLTICRAVKRM